MSKYVIIYDEKYDYYYASKKLFGVFNVGWVGIVSGCGSATLEGCEKNLRKVLKKGNFEKVVKEIEI
jgi:hypothetical protein